MKKTLLIILMISASLSLYSQSTKILCADETYYTESASGSFKIATSNDSIAEKIIKRFNGKIKSYSASQKKDRKGFYYLHTFSFPAEQRNPMVKFINEINK